MAALQLARASHAEQTNKSSAHQQPRRRLRCGRCVDHSEVSILEPTWIADEGAESRDHDLAYRSIIQRDGGSAERSGQRGVDRSEQAGRRTRQGRQLLAVEGEAVSVEREVRRVEGLRTTAGVVHSKAEVRERYRSGDGEARVAGR